MDKEILTYTDGPRRSRQRWGLSPSQWVILILMGGMLLAIGATLALIIKSGNVKGVDVLATAVAGPAPSSTPPVLAQDVVPTAQGLYWPPDPQPLATPNAPGNLLWWDARFEVRQPIVLDAIAAGSPPGTWARLFFDGEGAQRDGLMRPDGADLRILAWDGMRWWEIPRRAQPRIEKRGWEILFHLQDPEITLNGSYYLYYGNPLAENPPVAESAPETSRLLLELGERQSVEWSPEVFWVANGTAPQTVVSPDGRIVITCPPGGPAEDVRVRLRTVPVAENKRNVSVPAFELHADPPPGPPGPSNVAQWRPPLTVTINCAGLPVDVVDLETWVHFVYDTDAGTWRSIPVEFDAEKGLIRFTTEQP
jgi:hypothetical protein